MIDDEEVGTLVPPATVMKRMVTKSHDNDDDVDDNNQVGRGRKNVTHLIFEYIY